jgi:hypothetical protein
MLEGQRDNPAGWGEDNAAVEALWRIILCPSGPDSAKLLSEASMMLTSREYKDLTIPIPRYLDDKMGAGPKSVQSQTAPRLNAGQSERAITHYSSTEERSGIRI